jgi:hypothetical protein
VTNLEFTRTLGRVLGRPTVMPMPAFAARMAFGQACGCARPRSCAATSHSVIRTSRPPCANSWGAPRCGLPDVTRGTHRTALRRTSHPGGVSVWRSGPGSQGTSSGLR